MELEKLLTQPESKTLEFKSDLSSFLPILKTIVAFANTAGGILIIGRSPEGVLIGFEDVFKAEEQLANVISDSIGPAILPDIEIATICGKDILIVKVSYWKGPFYLKKQGIPGGVYIRLGSTSRPAGPEILAELQRAVSHQSFDAQPITELSIESLDLEKASLLFNKVGKVLDKDKLRSLGVLAAVADRLVPSIGGLILFGKAEERHRFLPDARVSCARFVGNDKVEFLDRYEIEGTILDVVDSASKFIARNTRLASEIKTIRRRDIPEYSPIAIREVLINALAHTDYSIAGSRIQIAIFNNRIEIQNPGTLPLGFTLEDFKDGVSRVRNRVIARVFSALELMEEWGSGYKRVTEACLEGGYPEPEWKELGTSFRVTFYPHAKTIAKEEIQTPTIIDDLLPKQQSILDLFSLGESLAFRQILEKLPQNMSERSLHYEIAGLKESGFLISKGKGRTTVWQRIR